MAGPFLKEMTVPIPEEGPVIIRNGKRVEYQLDRTYSPETQDSRVVRKVIGKVDPVQPGRMFPNETYFELFPENEVPAEVRDEFLRECAIKREMGVIRRNPEEVIDGVVRGLDYIARNAGTDSGTAGTMDGGGTAGTVDGGGTAGTATFVPHACNKSNRPLVPHACNKSNRPLVPLQQQEGGSNTENRALVPPHQRFLESEKMNYVMLRRVFDEIYYAMEELAGKYPNEKVDPFKVERINEVLDVLRESIEDERIKPFLRTIGKGLSYSDVLLMLKWYKVLPR